MLLIPLAHHSVPATLLSSAECFGLYLAAPQTIHFSVPLKRNEQRCPTPFQLLQLPYARVPAHELQRVTLLARCSESRARHTWPDP